MQNGNRRFHAFVLPRYGFFDATGRDAIAGSQYNDNGGAKGFVNSESEYKANKDDRKLLDQVTKSLLGGLDQKYANPSQQLNYVEVHDGKTLYDLLENYNKSDSKEQLKNRVQLATAMSALSQGIHFSQMGQEFARTKEHKHNTYNAGDVYNKIDWELVGKNPDMVNFYKALVAFRTQEPLMHLKDYNEVTGTGANGKAAKMVITNAQKDSGIITYELRGEKGDKYLVVFNNNTDNNNKGVLTLGDTNWYYGNLSNPEHHNLEGNRGKINEKNDFTNAFVVLSNSKNLYNKIGQNVGDKTVTLDHLSATVFYIPAKPQLSEIKTVKQTIHYVNKKGNIVSPEKERKVSFVTVTRQDPNLKFTFENSQLATEKNDLGHNKNILTGLRDNAEVTYAYYAEDLNGNPVEVSEKPSLDAKGVPVSESKNIIWKLASESGGFIEGAMEQELPTGYTSNKEKWLSSVRYYLEEVPHPEVAGYKVIEVTPDNVGNTDKVNLSILSMAGYNDIRVIYSKQTKALIVSQTDPENGLQDASKTPTNGYFVDGYEDEPINFDESQIKLDRLGYTYTVNGKSTLDDAIKETPTFGEKDTVFEVIYIPKDAKARVDFIDADDNDKVIKSNEITGKTAGTFKVTEEFPNKDNYDIVKWEPAKEEMYYFDKVDDTKAISQIIKVTLKHKHQQSQEETLYTVTYKGADVTENVQKIAWDVDKDLVTGKMTYTPKGNVTAIQTPDKEGYHPSEKQVSFEQLGVTSEKPISKTVTVTYVAVPKPTNPVKTIEKFIVSGKSYDSLPTVDGDLVHVETKVLEQGEEATYTWDKENYIWKEATPKKDRIEEKHYKLIKPWKDLEPATPIIPLTKLEPAEPIIPLTKLKPAKPIIPLTKLEPAKPVIPLTKLEPAEPIIPLTKLEPAKPIIPLTKLEPAKPIIPLTKLEAAKPIIPLTKLEPAEPIIPLTKLEAAKPIIPLTKLEAAKPIIPLTKLEPAEPITSKGDPLVQEAKPEGFLPLTKLEPAKPITSKGEALVQEAKPEGFLPLTKLEPAQRVETLKVEALIQPEKPELFLPEDFKSETLSQLSESGGTLSNTSEVEVLVQSEILSENSRNSDITMMSLEVTNSAKSSLSSKEDTSVLLPKTGEEEQLYLTMLGGLLFTLAMAGVGISDKSKKVND